VDLPDAADPLYELPLEDFVRERDALAGRLRQDGDKEAAAQVKQLTKPSRAAWAVNQLVRSQPKARQALVEAGEASQRAAERLGDPEAADELRLAATAGRRAVSELMAAARGLVSRDGKSLGEGPLRGVEDTLHAALADPEIRAKVAEGRLSRERQTVGFPGLVAAAPPAPTKARAAKAKPKPKSKAKAPAPKPPRKPKPPSRQAIAKAEREVRRREKALESARAEVAEAEQALAGAQEALEKAKQPGD
jgi:hypothetical protein